VRALTTRQPWGWAIVAGHKPVENRTWRPPDDLLGETIAIHAAAEYAEGGLRDTRIRAVAPQPLAWRSVEGPGTWAGNLATVWPLGGIIGTARLIAAHKADRCCAPWGDYRSPDDRQVWHWLLDEPFEFAELVPCRGMLGLWTIPSPLGDRFDKVITRHPPPAGGGTG
jgi:hypothetical protein